ncbi:MAG: RNA-binding protein [uncultured bacterium]|nr:MAG: RNA-binding protein [uncultured bacterium]
MAEQDQEFVEYIVKSIVSNPDDVKVARIIDERGVLLTLAVNPEDMGKIIGKEGRTAKALRTLLRVLGAKSNARINLKVEEPEGSTHVSAATTASTKSDDTSSDVPDKADDEEQATEVM